MGFGGFVLNMMGCENVQQAIYKGTGDALKVGTFVQATRGVNQSKKNGEKLDEISADVKDLKAATATLRNRTVEAEAAARSAEKAIDEQKHAFTAAVNKFWPSPDKKAKKAEKAEKKAKKAEAEAAEAVKKAEAAKAEAAKVEAAKEESKDEKKKK